MKHSWPVGVSFQSKELPLSALSKYNCDYTKSHNDSFDENTCQVCPVKSSQFCKRLLEQSDCWSGPYSHIENKAFHSFYVFCSLLVNHSETVSYFFIAHSGQNNWTAISSAATVIWHLWSQFERYIWCQNKLQTSPNKETIFLTAKYIKRSKMVSLFMMAVIHAQPWHMCSI